MLPILRSRFDELERQRRAFVDDFRALSPDQFAFRPAAGAWSCGDVMQHLILVEEQTLRFLTGKTPRPASQRTLAQRAKFMVFRALLPRGLRVKAPVAGVIPTLETSLDELAARWDAVRAGLEQYLETRDEPGLGQLVLKHPLGGPLPIVDALDVMRLHIVHHGHQLRRIRRSGAWPAAGLAGAATTHASAQPIS